MISTRLSRLAAMLLVFVTLGCEGPVGPAGPTGPQGPQGNVGPQGPAGPGVSYQVFEGPITSSRMTTATVATGGVPPGIVCYLNTDSTPTVWAVIALNTAQNHACGAVEDGSGYYGSATFDSSMVNSGWNVRIVLFWTTG